MFRSHTFFLPLEFMTLEKVVKKFQVEFDYLLEDTFTDEELDFFEKEIDSIAAIHVQPISSELSFEDFYSAPDEEQKQKFFFDNCRSSINLENLPYLESNPFQVTYLLELFKNFDEVLIDQGGVSELVFKENYITYLKKFRTIDSLISDSFEKPPEIKTLKPVDPIDFLILDVYQELDRLKETEMNTDELSDKVKKIYLTLKEEKNDASILLRKSGLNPKDFDDGLERLKFWLRKR